MEGKAEFAKAEQNRKIRIEEARAKHEAEKLNAQAEIERAKGAAEAIRIGNGSVTPTYIQYLWVLVIFINICIYVILSLLLFSYILYYFIYYFHLTFSSFYQNQLNIYEYMIMNILYEYIWIFF